MNKSPNKVYLVFIFLLGFLLYSNTLSHEYVLDDYSVIKDNRIVKQGLEGIPSIWKTHYRYGYGFVQANLYRPLTLSIFALEWEIAPNNASFAHWINVLLYAFLGMLVFLFLLELFGSNYRILAGFSTVLFISHPIHTEVVANIKSIDDILAMSFSLLGIILMLKNLKAKKQKYRWLSLFLFLLAFLCKESTVTMLLIIPPALVLFRQLKLKEAIKETAWFLIPFAVYLSLRIKVLGSVSGDNSIASLDNMLVSAPDLLTRFATAVKILGLYFWKLVFPHPLMNDYSINQIEMVGISSPWFWLSLLFYTALSLLMVKSWKKTPIVAFGIIFFLLTLSLYSNIFMTIGTAFGERLLFIPSLGFCILIAYLMLQLSQKLEIPTKLSQVKIPLVLLLIVVTTYSFKTIDRNKAWKDNLTLYSTDVANCDKSARCHYYYGLGLMKEKAMKERKEWVRNELLEQAAESFKTAIRIYPSYSDAWSQLGLAFYRLKNFRAAENAYLKAAEYNPSNATALSNLGSLYFELEKYPAAKMTLQRAVKANPNHLDAAYNYASTLGAMGEFELAITYFKKAIELNPNNPNYYQMAAITFQNMGNQQQANIYLQKAKQLSK